MLRLHHVISSADVVTDAADSFLVTTHLTGFRGEMSTEGPGAGMSIGYMSTHISNLP